MYYKKSGTLRGHHAVAMVGYGVYNDKPYYIVENSWGSSWGDKGFFCKSNLFPIFSARF